MTVSKGCYRLRCEPGYLSNTVLKNHIDVGKLTSQNIKHYQKPNKNV